MVDFVETGLEKETHPPLEIIQRGVVTKAGDFLNACFTTSSLLLKYNLVIFAVTLKKEYDRKKLFSTLSQVSDIANQVGSFFGGASELQAVVGFDITYFCLYTFI